MDYQMIIMVAGFVLAAYSVVGNDVIQTLGTFLVSNEKQHWVVLWAYAALILTITLVTGYLLNDGDVSWGRLSKIPLPADLEWWHVLPPLVLLIITYYGFPVSTTFIVLSVFSTGAIIEKMLIKSVTGYALAFVFALVVYLLIARKFESKSAIDKMEVKKHHRWWVVAQWFSTGFLWSQWLIQDFANIYVYLPRQLSLTYLLLSLALVLSLLALVFKYKGGRIQNVVTQKTNTANIRSATLIDLSYGLVLYFFTVLNPVPMSTTWVFVGILAGREYAINLLLNKHLINKTYKKIFNDLFKVNVGLAVSIIVALLIRSLK
jgi:phosphate/sulfate permease